ncbi:Multidrug resistance regulator 1 [Dissostichus eleginoides]|uniref:Multidrug resistance regulator 1 n=1 Tax=Dissostichus eleginoides TaxID=100907 RepID=A0AAD9ETW2_DISEL|nr:Multidrug resistance regulator 1 [Dissostichus eleginoides]
MAGPAVGVLSVGARGFRRREGMRTSTPLSWGAGPRLVCPPLKGCEDPRCFQGGRRLGLKRVCQVNIGYQPKVSGLGPASIDLTFRTKPQDPLWLPFSKLPAPPFSFEIYSPAEGERRGGVTVRQLFTAVLSSYFTRKQSHSFLNSSSWPVSSLV